VATRFQHGSTETYGGPSPQAPFLKDSCRLCPYFPSNLHFTLELKADDRQPFTSCYELAVIFFPSETHVEI
jgi:hypothetical protein